MALSERVIYVFREGIERDMLKSGCMVRMETFGSMRAFSQWVLVEAKTCFVPTLVSRGSGMGGTRCGRARKTDIFF